MPNTGNKNQGGSHEQHVKAGQQSHKNDADRDTDKKNDDANRSAGGASKGSGQEGSRNR